MLPARDFTGISKAGNLEEALTAAISAASRTGNGFVTWQLKDVRGAIGGVVGTTDLTVTITAGAFSGKAATPPSEWHAWRNRMPGTPPTLHVTGTRVMPAPGYTIELRPVIPQGFNPAIYILEEVIAPPTGVVPQVETPISVIYREVTDRVYTHVSIVPDNILIPVQEVS